MNTHGCGAPRELNAGLERKVAERTSTLEYELNYRPFLA